MAHHFQPYQMYRAILTLLTLVTLVTLCNCIHNCSELDNHIHTRITEALENTTIRIVDQSVSNIDTPECLNPNSSATPPPCATLRYALHATNDSSLRPSIEGLTVVLRKGTYSLVDGIRVINSRRVAIIGESVDNTIIHCGNGIFGQRPCSYENFQVRNSTHVLLVNLTFTACGPVTSNVYIAESEYIVIKGCVFRDNASPPVLVYDSPMIAFTNTTFRDNIPADLESGVATNSCYFPRGEHDIFIDNRTSSGGITFYMDDQSAYLLISDSNFLNNSARPDSYISLLRNSDGYGHGGGLTVTLVNSSESWVCLEGSVFDGNTAEASGGAIAVSFASFARQNRLVINRSTFINNSCTSNKGTGGAVGIDFFNQIAFNKIMSTDCYFLRNTAEAGGAISMATYGSTRINDEGQSDIVVLTRTRFVENKAMYEGTAVGVFSISHVDEIGIPVKVTDCHFESNHGIDTGNTSAITVYRVLITFIGTNVFCNNYGGGITLLGSQMNVDGEIVFERNRAVYGAGIAMSGGSRVLLFNETVVQFLNNTADQSGGGIYVENFQSAALLPIQASGCFIQYYSNKFVPVAVPPTTWNARVEFVGNRATFAGAAIYANDLERCVSADSNGVEYLIFERPQVGTSPFLFKNNKVSLKSGSGKPANDSLATDATNFFATTLYQAGNSTVSFGEKVTFILSSVDKLNNFREAAWSVNATSVPLSLGALSSNRSVFTYDVPPADKLNVVNNSANITVEFSLLTSQVTPLMVSLTVDACHPGYTFDENSQLCECRDNVSEIVRCGSFNRYFYVKEGFWVGVREDNTAYFTTIIPGFLNCTVEGTLPGCLFKFDHSDDQCSSGREGILCGECESGYGVTFDLRFCRDNCGVGGIVLFVVICVLTLIFTLLVLHFDFPIPNELKGVLFFAQVIGLIYRNTPYLQMDISATSGYKFFDFLINMLGISLPFPICFLEGVPSLSVAFLGFIPPLIALVTASIYACCANRVNWLSNRTQYGFHGFYFLCLFVYKYFVDTLFIFVSCTKLDGEYVFTYEGTVKCHEGPFLIALTVSAILLFVFGVLLPILLLQLVYRPQKAIQVSNALTRGLKDRRRYSWYGVWDIWRRLPFVAVNLMILFTTRSVVLFSHCMLIFICLTILCVFKPYKKYYINVLEACVIVLLFGATLALLDENDRYIGPMTSIVIVALPFTYGALFIFYWTVKSLWSKADMKWPLNRKLRVLWTKIRIGVRNWLDIEEQSLTNEQITDEWKTNDNQEDIRALELEIVPVFGNSNVELRESLLLDTHEENVSL